MGGKTSSASVAIGEVSSVVDPTSDLSNCKLRNTTGQPATLGSVLGDVPPGFTASGSLSVSYTMPAGGGVKQLVLSSLKKLTVAPDADGDNPTKLGVWVKGDHH